MATVPKTDKTQSIDRQRRTMLKLMQEIDARAGIAGEPSITAKQLRENQQARGVRPESNEGSRELMRMRYGDDWDEE